jgi:hypothetical protein
MFPGATRLSGRVRKRSGVADMPFHTTASAAAANHPPLKQPVAGGLPGPSLAAGESRYRTQKKPFLALQYSFENMPSRTTIETVWAYWGIGFRCIRPVNKTRADAFLDGYRASQFDLLKRQVNDLEKLNHINMFH